MIWNWNNGVWQNNEDSWIKEFIIIGAKKEDINIYIEGGYLIVSFDGNSYSSIVFHKTSIPDSVKKEDVSSTYEAGVLKVAVKKPDSFRSQKIPIG